MDKLLKIKKYAQFAFKSGRSVFGLDNIKKTKIKAFLFVLCNITGNSLRKNIIRIASENNVPIIEVSKEEMFDIVKKNNIGVFAITDENIAKEIIKE